ncbi:MAG: radical SAM protein [bacterium]
MADQGPKQVIDQGLQQKRHWVRITTACNNRCLFCLDADTPRDLVLSADEVRREIDRGLDEGGATRLILSGGEPTLHPDFPALVRYGRARGYDRVQCITNGHRFADREFLRACLDAGLGEITFSLHGHTAFLHDRLTQTPGSFGRLITGLTRALRDGRPVVNVDVCCNGLNIRHLEQIVELCISLGVTEFDLLHVIPQGAAFENRAQLFYDVAAHQAGLRRVLRLNRHPRYHIWTNRLPPQYLEGLEDLIQPPRKLLDEVLGRRYPLRAYVDLGTALDCRHVERCPSCYVEPFCTTLDEMLGRLHRRAYQVWWIGDAPVTETTVPDPLPFGCTQLGLSVSTLAAAAELEVAPNVGLVLRVRDPAPLSASLPEGRPLTLIADTDRHLQSWLGGPASLPAGVELDIELNRKTAPWLVANRDLLAAQLDVVRVTQPTFERLADTTQWEVEDPAQLFRTLDLPVRTSGLPACLAPGTRLVEPIPRLDYRLFDPRTGRLELRALACHHILENHRAKSARCEACSVNARCSGAHINTIRNQGFARLTPLDEADPWAREAARQLQSRHPEPPVSVARGRAPELPVPSLPGFEAVHSAPADPLAQAAPVSEAISASFEDPED